METSNFQQIFARIRKQLLPFGKMMEVRVDKEGAYQLYILGDVEISGRKFKECYFAGAVIQKTMVAFYFFPIYSHPAAFTVPAAIQKNCKGKSCFNFKKLDDVQEKAIAALLKDGAAFYKGIKIL